MDITGDPDLEPRFDTSFKMVYDDDYLYVLGNIQEPQVWGESRVVDARKNTHVNSLPSLFNPPSLPPSLPPIR